MKSNSSRPPSPPGPRNLTNLDDINLATHGVCAFRNGWIRPAPVRLPCNNSFQQFGVPKPPQTLGDVQGLGLSDKSFTLSAWMWRDNRFTGEDDDIFGTDGRVDIIPAEKPFRCHINGERLFMTINGVRCGGDNIVPFYRWFHATFVYSREGGVMKIFLNGKREAMCAVPEAYKGSAGMPLKLGASAGYLRPAGLIAYATGYRCALSRQQIQMVAGNQPREPRTSMVPEVGGECMTASFAETFQAYPRQMGLAGKLGLASSYTFTAWLWFNCSHQLHKIFHGGPVSMYIGGRTARHINVLKFRNSNADCMGETEIPMNEWFHAAFVYDLKSLTMEVYLNSAQDAFCTDKQPFMGGKASEMMLGHRRATSRRRPGFIAEAKFFGCALTPAQIALVAGSRPMHPDHPTFPRTYGAGRDFKNRYYTGNKTANFSQKLHRDGHTVSNTPEVAVLSEKTDLLGVATEFEFD